MDLLTFHLDEREFGVDLGRVREIISPPPITRVPGMPPALLGVFGLRGDPTAAVDAGIRLAGRPITISGRTPIVILSAILDERPLQFGLLVGAAGRKLSVEKLLPWTEGLARFTGDDPCMGFADVDGTFVLVLDVDKLLSLEQVTAFQRAAPARAVPPPLPASSAAPHRRAASAPTVPARA